MTNGREKDECISDHIFKNDSGEYVLKEPYLALSVSFNIYNFIDERVTYWLTLELPLSRISLHNHDIRRIKLSIK